MRQFQPLEFRQRLRDVLFSLPTQDDTAEADMRFAEIEQRFAERVMLADFEGGLRFFKIKNRLLMFSDIYEDFAHDQAGFGDAK